MNRDNVTIGNIVVVPVGTVNPYRASLPNDPCGTKRSELLHRFFMGESTEGYEFWYAPCCGGARKITSSDETAVTPEMTERIWKRSKK